MSQFIECSCCGYPLVESDAPKDWKQGGKVFNPEQFENVNRLEVIDKSGRAYVHYLAESEKVNVSVQDDGKTLKLFI